MRHVHNAHGLYLDFYAIKVTNVIKHNPYMFVCVSLQLMLTIQGPFSARIGNWYLYLEEKDLKWCNMFWLTLECMQATVGKSRDALNI